jgi:hypothetical protein
VKLWVSQKNTLLQTPFKRLRRHRVHNRNCDFPQLEAELTTYINRIRSQGGCLTGTAIRAKARLIAVIMTIMILDARMDGSKTSWTEITLL